MDRRTCSQCIASRGIPSQDFAFLEMKAEQFLVSQPETPQETLYLASNSRDRQAFFDLRTIVLQGLAGAFETHFWTVDAVRVIQTYPAAWHAGLAISSAFSLSQIDKSAARRQDDLIHALYHYNKAIRYFLNITRQASLGLIDMEALLLTNILFVGICCLQKDINSAVVHVQNGLKALHSWEITKLSKASTSTYNATILSPKSLIAIFSHFDRQLSTFCPLQVGQWQELLFDPISSSNAPFTSLSEVYFEFSLLQNSLCKPFLSPGSNYHGWLAGMYNPMPDLCHVVRGAFKSWTERFSVFINSRDYHGAADLEGTLTLQIRSIILGILLSLQKSDGQPEELAYDTHLSAFQLVVDLAQKLYDEISRDSNDSRKIANNVKFSYGISACEPLLVVMLCRDGTVRRKAIALLRKWPQTDGMWDPRLAALFVESVMEYEESHSVADEVARPAFCRCIRGSYICGVHRVTDRPFTFPNQGVFKVSLITGTTQVEGTQSTQRDLIIHW